MFSNRQLNRELRRRGASYRTLREMNLRHSGLHPITKFLFNIFLWGGVAVGVYVFFAAMTLPSLDSWVKETREPTITFIDRDGFEIQSINQIMGDPVSVKTLPKHVWKAVIAIEDKRFFKHGAVDLMGITRSLFQNLRSKRIVSGGSSITQQTAKNIFLTPKRTMHRKIQEMMMSVWLENRFSKTQILDLYLNRISISRGQRGIDAAARDIFNKPATDLTLAESAQIAAMLKAPTAYHPIINSEKNIARAKIVLMEMYKQKMITKDQLMGAISSLKKPSGNKRKPVKDLRYWTDFVMSEVNSRIGNNITTDLYVYTTIDSDLQYIASDQLRDGVNGHQGAVVAINRLGEIVTMVGGTDYGESQFNRVIAMRQPGSTFKPVIYLVALENGMNPQNIVEDSAFAIGDYNPRNYNEKYYGPLTLSDAFAKSVNSVPLKLTAQWGLDSVLSMASRLGVGSKLRRDYSTVLGSSEMTLLDLTTMYATIWNNGYSMHPFSIRKITTPNGKILYSRKPSDPMKLLKDQTVTYMTDLLGNVIKNGTGKKAYVPGKTIGGKTGTSDSYRDAWFIGSTNNLTIGIWVGNDNFAPMDNITGGSLPADIFREILLKIM